MLNERIQRAVPDPEDYSEHREKLRSHSTPLLDYYSIAEAKLES
jgi:hypothetical protein